MTTENTLNPVSPSRRTVFCRTLIAISVVALLTIILWPGVARPAFQQGQEPIITEGWAQTAGSAASAGECTGAGEVCVEWCQLIDGEPRFIQGTLCCVQSDRIGDDNFGDCLRRVN